MILAKPLRLWNFVSAHIRPFLPVDEAIILDKVPSSTEIAANKLIGQPTPNNLVSPAVLFVFPTGTYGCNSNFDAKLKSSLCDCGEDKRIKLVKYFFDASVIRLELDMKEFLDPAQGSIDDELYLSRQTGWAESGPILLEQKCLNSVSMAAKMFAEEVMLQEDKLVLKKVYIRPGPMDWHNTVGRHNVTIALRFGKFRTYTLLLAIHCYSKLTMFYNSQVTGFRDESDSPASPSSPATSWYTNRARHQIACFDGSILAPSFATSTI